MDQITSVNLFENIKSREKVDEARAQMRVQKPGGGAVESPHKAPAPPSKAGEPNVEFDPFQGTYVRGEGEKRVKRPFDPRTRQLEQFSETLADDIFARFEQDEQRHAQLSRGVSEKISVLFADVRGFARVCEALPPDRVFRLLNIFYSEMIRVIRDEHGGFIDKIIGDSIMAFFGIPYSVDCSRAAVETAIAMQNAMPAVNRRLESHGLPDISIGIGINTGQVHAGFITTERNISGFTVIGQPVNVASMIERLAGPGDIFIGETTRNETLEYYTADEIEEPVMPAGEEGPEYKIFSVRWRT